MNNIQKILLDINNYIENTVGIDVSKLFLSCVLIFGTTICFDSACIYTFVIYTNINMLIILSTYCLLDFKCNVIEKKEYIFRRLFPYMIFLIAYCNVNICCVYQLSLIYFIMVTCVYDELSYMYDITSRCLHKQISLNEYNDINIVPCERQCTLYSQNECISSSNCDECSKIYDKEIEEASEETDDTQPKKRKYVFKKEPHERAKRGRKPSVVKEEEYRRIAREIASDFIKSNHPDKIVNNSVNNDNDINGYVVDNIAIKVDEIEDIGT